MLHGKVATLYVPVDRDGFEVIYRKFTLRNVSYTSASKGVTSLYVFYDRVKFYLGGKRVPPFKIREGSFIVLGEVSPNTESFTFTVPGIAVTVAAAEHYVAGNLKVHHTRLLLK